ncbi:CYTH domain-containing protein [Desulfuromonas thiophila]|uniref:Adenylate cyclase n=1 Tax=Desulfuromonas thiophila TaxID=57664 RepID=A0A1G7CE27_9BACT|nr:CYTH domain-containing protein [Desulfuromonas thiophila]SDE36665.1 adenylate cyclase [Desulfuromonas thiophila]
MGVEIERKFLLCGDGWRQQARSRQRLCQGYLCSSVERTVRVRLAGEQAWLTIKGPTQGLRRAEYEYAIPATEAAELLQLCQQPLIDKWRYLVWLQDQLWEIDEFLGANSGLLLAEIELPHEDAVFVRPDWLGPEVSAAARYSNACLQQHPYSAWSAAERANPQD